VVDGSSIVAPAIFALVIGALLLSFAPRFMVLMIWPVVMCYPQQFFLGLLPWNAGLDDLFIIVVASRILLHPRPDEVSSFGRGAVFVVIGMLIMETVSEFTGVMRYPVLLQTAAKTTLKGVVAVLFALAMAIDIRNERDVHRHIIAFALAASLALALVVVCFYIPGVAHYWEVQKEELLYQEGTAVKRAFGPFNGATDVGFCVCVIVPCAIGLLTVKPRRRFVGLAGWLMLVTSLAALLVAKTRAGAVGLAGMFVLMTLFSRQRRYIIAMELVGILIAGAFLAGGEILGTAQERFTVAKLSRDLATRVDLWIRTISNPSPWILFCGEGYHAFWLRMGRMTPHNGYLDILFLWGLGGVVMFATLIRKAATWSSLTYRADPDSCCRGVALGLWWTLIATAGLALTSDPWYSTFYRYMVYFLMVVVCVRHSTLRASMAPFTAAAESTVTLSRY
jgi:hypothetical protein